MPRTTAPSPSSSATTLVARPSNRWDRTAGFNPTIPSLMVTQNDAGGDEDAAFVDDRERHRGRRRVRHRPQRALVDGRRQHCDRPRGCDCATCGNPNCYTNPNRVSDPMYHCAATDNGGVHINSGVDNRAFSLLVDGGTHNGVTVGAIGMTKATHIWFRAKVTYQYPATTFADHADALEESCSDLIGKNLNSLTTGTTSGQKINVPGLPAGEACHASRRDARWHRCSADSRPRCWRRRRRQSARRARQPAERSSRTTSRSRHARPACGRRASRAPRRTSPSVAGRSSATAHGAQRPAFFGPHSVRHLCPRRGREGCPAPRQCSVRSAARQRPAAQL